MSIDQKSAGPPEILISLTDAATLLLKENNIHDGLFELAFEMQVSIGSVGSEPESTLPGIAVAISKIGLSRVEKMGSRSVDASLVNPRPGPTRSKTALSSKPSRRRTKKP